MLSIPGAMESGLRDPLFWGSLALALAVAFVVTVPVNRWLIARGRGHAAAHAVHGPGDHDAGASAPPHQETRHGVGEVPDVAADTRAPHRH
jgi:hypothetical protein